MKALKLLSLLGCFVVLLSCENQLSMESDIHYSSLQDSIRIIVESSVLHNSIYENQARVNQLSQMASTKSNDPNFIFNYARELLNNGEVDKSISTLESFMNSTNYFSEVNTQNKQFFDLQALLYLRKGELDNCIENHTQESCIVPISEMAQHVNKNGSNKAKEIYETILKSFPNDNQTRWLLAVANMTLGTPLSNIEMANLGTTQKVENGYDNISGFLGIDHFGLSGGSIADDFNNDGYIDLICSTWGLNGQVVYYENTKIGGFTNKTKSSKLDQVTGGLNLLQTDYNNDGLLDFYILRGGWRPQMEWGILPNSLMKNNGDGTFTDVTVESGLYHVSPTQSAAWADFNLDGWIDLFVANETTPSSKQSFPTNLFLNNRGVFVEKASQYGLNLTGYFKGCTVGDYNNDGWPDLFVSNLNGENKLLVNIQKDSEFFGFNDVSSNSGVLKPDESFPTWTFDFNNDGLEDIYVANFDREAFMNQSGLFYEDIMDINSSPKSNCLYQNLGNLKFKDVTASMFDQVALSTMGCNIGDIDNDGFLDFYLGTGAPDFRSVVPNRLFHNEEGNSFSDVTFKLGVGHIQKGHAISFADFDNDGDQEIYAVMGGAFEGDKFQNALFENSIEQGNWIKLKIVGEKSNRGGVGARIVATVELEDGSLTKVYKTVNSGASFGCNPLEQTIGLGQAKQVKKLSVTWPNKERSEQVFTDLKVNTRYTLIEGKEIEPKDLAVIPYLLSTNHQNHIHHH